ncbi:MAG: hypothetical protein QXO52_06765, partial [Thermosphaera sp.]
TEAVSNAMECLITATATIAAALYTTLRVEKTLRRATESVSENKREQRQRAEVQRAELSSTAKLEEATKLPPIAYVRGGIEILSILFLRFGSAMRLPFEHWDKICFQSSF